MTDTGSPCATGEAAVGNQRHRLSQSHPHYRRCRPQHLHKAGAAFWPLKAYNHHFAMLDAPLQDGGTGFCLSVKEYRRSFVTHHLRSHCRRLHHCSVRRQAAKKDLQSSDGAERPIQTVNHRRVEASRRADILA